jgi:hypothetical protein
MQNGPDGKLDRGQGCGVGMFVKTDLLSFAKFNVAELFEGVCFSGQAADYSSVFPTRWHSDIRTLGSLYAVTNGCYMCEISISRNCERVSHSLLPRRPGFIGFLSFRYYWTRCLYLLRHF